MGGGQQNAAIGTIAGAVIGAALTWWAGGVGAGIGASIGSIAMGAGVGASVGAATATLLTPQPSYFTPQGNLSYGGGDNQPSGFQLPDTAGVPLNARDAATLNQAPDLLDTGDGAKKIRNQATTLLGSGPGSVGEAIAPKSPIMTEDERERRRIQLAKQRRDTMPSLLGGGSAPGEPLL